MRRFEGILPVALVALGVSVSIASADAAPYLQTDLVSDISGLARSPTPSW